MKYNEKIVYYCTKENFVNCSTDEVVRIDLRTHQTELDAFFGEPLTTYEGYMQAVINGTWEDYVIYKEGKIAARAAIWWSDNQYGDITCVFTLPEYRGQGLATKLVTDLTRKIIERGKYPNISTNIDNFAMRRVCDKVGYIPQ